MRFSYRLAKDTGGYVAECVESDAEGMGKTPEEAIESLRHAIAERMFRPDAVAPPPAERSAPIELVPDEQDPPPEAPRTPSRA
jgi:hypothetical protein